MKNTSVDNSELLKHSKTWDRTGVFVAALCLVHCLALPFIMAAMPATRAFFDSIVLELVILFLGVVIGTISFITSFKKHRKFGPMILGALGVFFLVANLGIIRWTAEHSHFLGTSFRVNELEIDPLMILGGIFLVAGHMWNIHACHCFCDADCGHEHPDHSQDHSH